jgi:hypothetical protein
MDTALITLLPLALVAVFFHAAAKQLGKPSGWFGFRLYSVRQAEALVRAAGFAVELRGQTRGEVIVIGRAL